MPAKRPRGMCSPKWAGHVLWLRTNGPPIHGYGYGKQQRVVSGQKACRPTGKSLSLSTRLLTLHQIILFNYYNNTCYLFFSVIHFSVGFNPHTDMQIFSRLIVDWCMPNNRWLVWSEFLGLCEWVCNVLYEGIYEDYSKTALSSSGQKTPWMNDRNNMNKMNDDWERESNKDFINPEAFPPCVQVRRVCVLPVFWCARDCCGLARPLASSLHCQCPSWKASPK